MMESITVSMCFFGDGKVKLNSYLELIFSFGLSRQAGGDD